ncbi:MAG TPA: copper chaperone PCu(A)C [Longimicrobiales bacterium]|nr:copper chaperone PCu(A)C [Longimicrobiales bacterium]
MNTPAARRLGALLAALPLVAVVSACRQQPQAPSPAVEDAWVRAVRRPRTPPPGGVNSAAYMTLRNGGAQAARLVGATSPAADSVQIHQSTVENGIARMRRVDGLDLPPGGAVRFAPGGYHVMLLGVHRSLIPGDTVRITLHFASAPDIKLQVPVQ